MATETTQYFDAIRIDNPSDLEVDKVFVDDELIIQSDEKTMTTIRHDEGFLGKREYQITISRYNVRTSKSHTSLIYNGFNEVFIDENHHAEYKSKLEQMALW